MKGCATRGLKPNGRGCGNNKKIAPCSLLPDGRVISVSNYWGAVGSVGGSLDLVMNYNTGDISGFATGGFQGGCGMGQYP